MTPLVVVCALVFLFYAAPVTTFEWIGEKTRQKAAKWSSLFPKKEEKKKD
jgi:hypothetical protein